SMRDALSLLDQVLAFGGGRAIESEVRTLLGTLDRRHVEGILNALAAQDGAALMACVAQLDERAPDYDQALGELSAAIQRMALLQALPELRGEDEEQDAALAQLATKFLPEDLQLLYQIAIMARRDLDYAPDARGGFEMALLRMLAFRPESLSGAAPPGPPPAAKAASGTSATRRSAVAPQAFSAPPAEPATPRPAAQPDVSIGGDWPAIVAALGLQGPAGQLAAHCVLVGRTNDVVRLRLDSAGEVFRRPQLEQKLAQALAQHFGQPMRLDIAVSDAEEVTPARQQARAADARLKAAEQAIEADSNVRAMREVFGATVQPGSVKPLN
ncbi:MAG TPA: DNA polymerase III subunit gamma/tau C-terminal domain-containing protein, partial [Steroidobacteraceae bacterium]|nr:DNA polymerase III subunit gamma/tau C-terminal domain-containing protein [Steroidobacteraceae bacterium]